MFAIASLAEQVAGRFLNHWLQPFLEKEMRVSFEFSNGALYAKLTDFEFSPEKMNELFSKFNLPFIINDAKIDKLVLEMHFTSTTNYKVRITVDGLKSTIIPLEPSNYANVVDSMIDSFYEHQKVPLDDILNQLGADSERYKEITAQETSKKLLLALNDIIDISLENSAIRVEHFPDCSSKGIALEVRLHKIKVFTDAIVSPTNCDTSSGGPHASSLGSSDTSVSRCVSVEGVSLWVEEIIRTLADVSCYTAQDQSISSVTSETEWKKEIYNRDDTTPVKFASVPGETLFRIAFQEKANRSSVQMIVSVSDIAVFITPRHVFLLGELLSQVSSKAPAHSAKLGSTALNTSDYDLLERQQAAGATSAELGTGCFLNDMDSMSVGRESLSVGRLPSASRASGWSMPRYEFRDNSSMGYSRDYQSRVGSLSEESTYNYRPHYAQSTATSDVSSVITQSDITCRTHRGSALSVKSTDSMVRSRDWMKDPLNHVVETRLELRVNSVCAVVLHEDVIVPDGSATYKELETEAFAFFNVLKAQTLSNLENDITSLRHQISNQLKRNHFQFVATKITTDAVHTRKNEAINLMSVFRIHNMELVECVVEKGALSTACYVDLLTFKNDGLLARGNPCFNLSYETSSEIRNTYKGFIDTGNSKSEISLALANCATEVDFSLVDRAEAFFKHPEFFDDYYMGYYDETAAIKIFKEASVFRHELKMTCSCSSIDVRLRFPVPDLRPISDILTKEIWKRDVRNDVLTITFDDLSFSTRLSMPVNNYPKQIKVLCGSASLLFQECAGSEQYKLAEISRKDESLPISLLFEISSHTTKGKAPLSVSQKSYSRTRYGNPLPKPFFEKNLVSSPQDAIADPLLFPAEEGMFANFMAYGCKDAEIHLTAELPCVRVFLPSKHIYEVVYNRLAYDLLLWQPHSSHPIYQSQSNAPAANVCPSYLGDSMTSSIYHSFSCDPEESGASPGCATGGQDDTASHQPQTKTNTLLGVVLKIEEGSIVLNTPYTDDKGVLKAESVGRVLLDASNLTVFVAAAYHGNKNKSYVAVYANDLGLSHNPKWCYGPSDPQAGPKEMQVVIEKCDSGLLKTLDKAPSKETGMLSLVMNFDFDEARNVNTMTLSCKLKRAAYLYSNAPVNEQWVTQLQDMFAVQDYPISGYEMPEVVNDIHCSFVNCLVRYEPESFNSEALLYIGSLILASSLSYTCDITIFRTILEDASFHLTKAAANSNRKVTAKVLNTGVLQLTIRRALRNVNTIPDLEIVVFGSLVTLTTCTDSLAELMKYVSHFSASEENPESDVDSESEESSSELERNPAVDEQAMQHRKALLADAIQEADCVGVGTLGDDLTSISPFVFPDDDQGELCKDSLETYKPRYDDRCTVLHLRKDSNRPNSVEVVQLPVKRWPNKKSSLRAQVRVAEASTPLIRWTVKDLSLCVKLCQGHAFSFAYADVHGSSNDIHSHSSVAYSSKDSRLSFNQPSPSVRKKEVVGSKAREYQPLVQINLKKLRYSFESYAPDSLIACSHSLSLRDAEVLDLVPNSNLRKLLCRHITDQYPIGDKSDFLRVNFSVKRRPNELHCKECYLDISLGNIRMYVDQATVTFLMDFFKELSCIQDEKEMTNVTSVGAHASVAQTRREHRHDRRASTPPEKKPFIKSLVFNPAAVILIDFEGNFSDISSVHELILAMSSANNIELRLKEINFQRGILGMDKVLEFFKKEWLDDFYANQKMGLVKLIAPVGLLIEIVGGLWELVDAPFQQYMKDGNIFRGLMLGSKAFTQRSMAATFGLLGKFFNCLENIASFLMVVVSHNHRLDGPRAPPSDAVSGVCVASNLVRDRVRRVTSNVIESTLSERRERGVAGALSGFSRHVPEIVFTPPFLATQVTGCILSGLQQQWTPDNKKELHQKYK